MFSTSLPRGKADCHATGERATDRARLGDGKGRTKRGGCCSVAHTHVYHTSEGSASQASCYSSIWVVLYQRRAVVLLLQQRTQQGGRCYRAVRYLYSMRRRCYCFLFGGFTSIHTHVLLDIYNILESRLRDFGVGIAVLRWQFLTMEVEIAILH